jgi:hypothetical protein
MKKLHEQTLKCKPHNKKFLTWAFFYVNDESSIDVKSCIVCYVIVVLSSFVSIVQGWKFHCKYRIDEDKSLNIFEMVVGTCELAKELVNKELLIFCRY